MNLIAFSGPRYCSATLFLVTVWASLFLGGTSRGDEAPPPFALKDGDKVVFYGDSITDQRLYAVFTETFILTRYPNLKISYVHSGWSGDRVTGGDGGPIDLRLERNVFRLSARCRHHHARHE
jgi:hypothetical protein